MYEKGKLKMDCVAEECGYTIMPVGDKAARLKRGALQAEEPVEKYKLSSVSDLCTARLDGNTINDGYVRAAWFDDNPNIKRIAFYAKRSARTNRPSVGFSMMHGFAIYETANINGSGLLEWKLHLICVSRKAKKAKDNPTVGIFKYMLSQILVNLTKMATLSGAREARLKIMAIESAYNVWWRVGFRPLLPLVDDDDDEFPVDGKPLYLWVKDDEQNKNDWMYNFKREQVQDEFVLPTTPWGGFSPTAWINDPQVFTTEKPSSPWSFYDFASVHNDAEKQFQGYSYSENYGRRDLWMDKEERELFMNDDYEKVDYLIM